MAIEKITLGTVNFGVNYGLNQFKIVRNDCFDILDCAFENNIKKVDTAKSYGESEELIGNYHESKKKYFSVFTKIDSRNKDYESQILESLNKTCFKSISVLAHNTKISDDHKFHEDICKLKECGIVKEYGVSVYTSQEIENILNSKFKIDIIQLPFNALDTRNIHNGLLKDIVSKKLQFMQDLSFCKAFFI